MITTGAIGSRDPHESTGCDSGTTASRRQFYCSHRSRKRPRRCPDKSVPRSAWFVPFEAECRTDRHALARRMPLCKRRRGRFREAQPASRTSSVSSQVHNMIDILVLGRRKSLAAVLA